MNPAFLDPNNHVPELTQGDDWDDVDEKEITGSPSFASLPPRRSVLESSPADAERSEVGLRIGSSVSRDDWSSHHGRLEIQEFNSGVIRLQQEIPPPTKMERVIKFHEKPSFLQGMRHPRGEGKEWGVVYRGSNRWIFSMGIAILIIVVLGIAVLPKINAPNAIREIPIVVPTDDDDDKSEDFDALNEMVTRQPEAMTIFKSFVHASLPEQIVPLVRKHEVLLPELSKSWNPIKLPQSWEPSPDSSWTTMKLAGQPCGLLEGNFPNQSKFRAYFIDDHGKFLLDWPATVAYGTATFEDLADGEGDGSEIRGIISMADYYTSAFPESTYQSFRLISPHDEITIWCYLPRESPTYQNLMSRLQTSLITQEPPVPQKIALWIEHKPGEALANQWLIRELLHFEWLSP